MYEFSSFDDFVISFIIIVIYSFYSTSEKKKKGLDVCMKLIN